VQAGVIVEMERRDTSLLRGVAARAQGHNAARAAAALWIRTRDSGDSGNQPQAIDLARRLSNGSGVVNFFLSIYANFLQSGWRWARQWQWRLARQTGAQAAYSVMGSARPLSWCAWAGLSASFG
jgi:hypothetical protein